MVGVEIVCYKNGVVLWQHKKCQQFFRLLSIFFFSLHSFLHEMSFGKKGVSSWCYMACLFYHSGAEEAPFVMNEFIQEQCWGLHPSRKVSTFDTFVDCIPRFILHFQVNGQGRLGAYRLALDTNDFKFEDEYYGSLDYYSNLGGKEYSNTFHTKVPFWSLCPILRYIQVRMSRQNYPYISNPNVFVPLDEKHCVFFPIPIPQYENKTPCLRAWPATLMMKVKTILISG